MLKKTSILHHFYRMVRAHCTLVSYAAG